jgi:hypothetical protein
VAAGPAPRAAHRQWRRVPRCRARPWCRAEGIRCTRGRPDKKNDQAWAEQRNWTAVRQLVGYDRYASQAALAQLGRLYPLVRDYAGAERQDPVEISVVSQSLIAGQARRPVRARAEPVAIGPPPGVGTAS